MALSIPAPTPQVTSVPTLVTPTPNVEPQLSGQTHTELKCLSQEM